MIKINKTLFYEFQGEIVVEVWFNNYLRIKIGEFENLKNKKN